MVKQEIATIAHARNIDARNGGSITKKRMTPETSASRLATIATATQTRRIWGIKCTMAETRSLS